MTQLFCGVAVHWVIVALARVVLKLWQIDCAKGARVVLINLAVA